MDACIIRRDATPPAAKRQRVRRSKSCLTVQITLRTAKEKEEDDAVIYQDEAPMMKAHRSMRMKKNYR